MSDHQPGNPLIHQPWLYEYIYPELGNETAEACRNILSRFSVTSTPKVLEIGCGIGRVLASLTPLGDGSKGIDTSEEMVDYASVIHPDLCIQLGDMRTFSLNETFDVLLCVGSTFTTNLTNSEIHCSLANFHKHISEGGLLILGVLNAARFLGSETFNESMEVQVNEGEFHATGFARHLLDRRRQCFRRVRTWRIEGQAEPVIDDAEFRLLLPMELEDYLRQHGFALLGMWDNSNLEETDFSGRRVYVAARAIV